MSDGAEPQDHVPDGSGGVGGEHRRHTSDVSDGAEPQDHVPDGSGGVGGEHRRHTSHVSSEGWFDTVASDLRYEGFSDVRVDTVRMPDGSQTQREVVEHDDVVAMVPVLDDGSVLLLLQYRHPVGRYLLEIPAGTLDEAGETPEEAAQRELAEEVEHRAGTLTWMITVDVSPGWSTETTQIFLARDLEATGRPAGFTLAAEEADMEVVRLPLDVAVEQAHRGELTDAKTVIGLLLAAARLAH